MSFYSANQRCPRCQYPNPPGTLTCGNCGLALSSAPPTPYGSDPLGPPPPPPPPPGNYGPPPGTSYGSGSYSGSAGYDFTNQPPPSFPGGPTYYPGSQPQSFSPTDFSQPPAKQRSRRGLKIALIVLVVLVVLGGGGGVAAYLLTRPKPTITVTSQYTVGTTPAGSTSTVFQVSGQRFSGNSTITFLLDGQIAPGSQTVQSDSSGNVNARLTVSTNWSIGRHTLTAKDASGYITQTGVSLDVVNQGEAGTPGPNGSPSDTSNFSVTINVARQDASTGQSLDSFKLTLTVTGQGSPQVCEPDVDDGQPHTYTGTDNIGAYSETYVWKCTGSYKAGKLSYTETTTSDKLTYTNGISCTATTPYTFTELDGSFTSATASSGTYSQDLIQYTCNKGGNLHVNAEKGTWTGKSS